MRAIALESAGLGLGAPISPTPRPAHSPRRSSSSQVKSKMTFTPRPSEPLDNSNVWGIRAGPGRRVARSFFSSMTAMTFPERDIESDAPCFNDSSHWSNANSSIPIEMTFKSMLCHVRLVLAQLQLHRFFKSHKLQGTRDVAGMPAMMLSGLIGTALTDLSGNHVFMSAFWAWLTAQVMKYFTAFYREGRWDWRVMFDSGGMPSSHTSLVVGLTTGIAYQYGLGSTLFPLSLAFSLIVMYDAAGVRRHAGKQAEVLNKILDDMFHGESISERKLKEVLGHSPLQVLAGAVLGVFIGVLYMYKFSSGYGVGA